MSLWRKIWKDSIVANRVMAEDLQAGEKCFRLLLEKHGEDGMIHYVLGESWEFRKDFQKAVAEYEKAEANFPVPHWKKVARLAISRLQSGKSDELFFDTRFFEQAIQFAVQKCYEYVRLNDDECYKSISALSRGDSEWSQSLMIFRSVLETETRRCFPELVIDGLNYNLSNALEVLENRGEIPEDVYAAMKIVKENGNTAAHDAEKLWQVESEKSKAVMSFAVVLQFFNGIEKKQAIPQAF